ncbi:DNA-binding transcription factor Pcr1 [Schizosaccharomyces pombe]|uniref:Transcription factor pcr1 n=1 Tax=Schizosaccharomyces pombe (strain 972 / ATCC 24843) TaxID=284812 RepID=PCR1_SCHPO|nr:transcription factor Pcr1 [Schizosaccharomyces pombe]Q09926.1 RecName: Full=Transcription factor pcr1; AltName: Full=Transcription factor mts2 [Schizosaccharomyces pombe 972h-]AAB46991.1 transcription factor Mts2 [Schizosaccharomyces pombe]BAA09818.1 CREB/ATF protein [Schizosaccharomyces pombe]CAA91968.1 transcription factor Pcr1 [Schizosaccharomyces pombe]|eukprot:NP_594500.1 transcription factor Pcr1 [Schizosaccharomyces pombe]
MTAKKKEVDDEKRRRILERNRIAASKFRQKKKEWIKELEQTANAAFEQSKRLQLLLSQLQQEAFRLKSQLLAHQGCQCSVKIRSVLTDFQTAHNALHSQHMAYRPVQPPPGDNMLESVVSVSPTQMHPSLQGLPPNQHPQMPPSSQQPNSDDVQQHMFSAAGLPRSLGGPI